MATLTRTAESPGQGGHGAPIFFGGPRHVVARHYRFAFDSSYPTGGEDISDIFNDFATGGVLMILVDDNSSQASVIAKVDYTNKKLMLYTAIGTQVTDTTSETAVSAMNILAIGYPA